MADATTVYLLVPAGTVILATCATTEDAWRLAEHCDLEYQVVAASVLGPQEDGRWYYRATWSPVEGAVAGSLWPQALGKVPNIVWPPTFAPSANEIDAVFLAANQNEAKETIAAYGMELVASGQWRKAMGR